MQKHNQKLGVIGEEIAARYLKEKKFIILEQNYSCKWGEIDIIALKDKRLHFVEVKTRSNLDFGRPEMAVTRNKYNSAKRAVLVYLRTNNLNNYIFQIDIIAIIYNFAQNKAQIRYFSNIIR